MHKLDDVLTGAVKTTGAEKDKSTPAQLTEYQNGYQLPTALYDQLKDHFQRLSSLKP